MTAGLPLSDIVNAQVTLDPQASATRNFGTLLIVGSESVLSDTEDLRSYSSLDSVGDDYAVTSPVYLAATLFYAQSPQPSTLYVGEQRTSETNLTTTVQRLAAASGDWYGLAFAMATMPTDTVIVQVAQQIEALTPVRTFWATTQDANAIVSSGTTDLAYLLCQANVSRTWCQYSTSNPYASISAFARIATVNYSGQNTTLTLKFKNEPDVTSEALTTTEYSALKAKYCNVFALLQNGESIIQEGYMADGTWADTRIGCDAFQNGLQVAGFNLLYSNLKIPQTDAGMVILKGTYDTVCQTYVTNGLFAPGVWTGPTIGALKNGDTLNDGYYIYCPSVASQSAADRSARKAVTMQIACKLAGAVHSSNVLVNVVQ